MQALIESGRVRRIANRIKREIIEEVTAWAKEQDVKISESGSTPVTGFCFECESCPYRSVDCTLMTKEDSSEPAPISAMQRLRKMEKIRGKSNLVKIV